MTATPVRDATAHGVNRGLLDLPGEIDGVPVDPARDRTYRRPMFQLIPEPHDDGTAWEAMGAASWPDPRPGHDLDDPELWDDSDAASWDDDEGVPW